MTEMDVLEVVNNKYKTDEKFMKNLSKMVSKFENSKIEADDSKKEKMKNTSKEYYKNKIHTDSEFYASEKKRVCEYINNRYKNDPEYRERLLQQKRESYKRKKEAKKAEMSVK
jgi:hypothetical protein